MKQLEIDRFILNKHLETICKHKKSSNFPKKKKKKIEDICVYMRMYKSVKQK